MNEDNNEQTELLRNIWNEMKALGQNLGGRIDKTNERLDQTNGRLDSLRVELKQEISSVRTDLGERLDRVEAKVETMSTRLLGVEGAIKELTAQHRWMSSFVDSTIDRHEQDISLLKERMAQVEARQGEH